MSEKRFLLDKLEKGNAILSVKITDTVKDVDYFIMTKEFYEDEIDDIVDLLNEQQAEIERLKKPILKDNQETEVRECQFCGEFRTEYHEYEDYSWSAEDYCNAGHDLEDTDPNSCKDYWDND